MPKTARPEVLARIRDVIGNVDTPTWMDSVPSNFGTASAGTLKAAEWRVLITILLPIALISLWGEGSLHDTPEAASKFRTVLDHTMCLVSAIRLACYRSMTTRHANEYRTYISRYIRNLKVIHSNVEYVYNHHMSLHIYDFLISMGPVRSWWMFPFECQIGHLQRLPQNHQHGMSNVDITDSQLIHPFR